MASQCRHTLLQQMGSGRPRREGFPAAAGHAVLPRRQILATRRSICPSLVVTGMCFFLLPKRYQNTGHVPHLDPEACFFFFSCLQQVRFEGRLRAGERRRWPGGPHWQVNPKSTMPQQERCLLGMENIWLHMVVESTSGEARRHPTTRRKAVCSTVSLPHGRGQEKCV